MVCNFHGMLKAPTTTEPAPVYIATYSDGFNFKRREIAAPNSFSAYAKATVYKPEGHTLTNLRMKKRGAA